MMDCSILDKICTKGGSNLNVISPLFSYFTFEVLLLIFLPLSVCLFVCLSVSLSLYTFIPLSLSAPLSVLRSLQCPPSQLHSILSSCVCRLFSLSLSLTISFLSYPLCLSSSTPPPLLYPYVPSEQWTGI